MVSKSQKINPLLRVGDHLIARRFAYTHHGLYMGDGKVLEYIQNGGVTIVPLETFAQRHAVYIREHSEAKFTGEKAVKRGLTRLGENNYNLLTCNCEHFVNWCIDGVSNSRQVDNLILTIIPFYSLFHKSNFIRGCLKIVFDNPASLDAALERINIHNLNVIDPLTRAKELSEDVLGTQRQGIVNLTAKITSATQLSKEYTSWLRYKKNSITSHLAALNRTLSHPAATLHLIGNKLGLSTGHTFHKTHEADAPMDSSLAFTPAIAAETAPAPAVMPSGNDTVPCPSFSAEETNHAPTPAALELHAEAMVNPPESFWQRQAMLRDPSAHHSWLGTNLATVAASKLLGRKDLQTDQKAPLDPDLSARTSDLHEAVNPEFAEFELNAQTISTNATASAALDSTSTAASATVSAASRALGAGVTSSYAENDAPSSLKERSAQQQWQAEADEDHQRALSARLPEVHIHLQCSTLNGEAFDPNTAQKELQRASLRHSQSELEAMVAPQDWHSSVSQKQALSNTTQDYERSSMGNAYTETKEEYGYSLNDLVLEVAHQVTQDLRTQQRSWRRQQRQHQSHHTQGAPAPTTTTASVPLQPIEAVAPIETVVPIETVASNAADDKPTDKTAPTT